MRRGERRKGLQKFWKNDDKKKDEMDRKECRKMMKTNKGRRWKMKKNVGWGVCMKQFICGARPPTTVSPPPSKKTYNRTTNGVPDQAGDLTPNHSVQDLPTEMPLPSWVKHLGVAYPVMKPKDFMFVKQQTTHFTLRYRRYCSRCGDHNKSGSTHILPSWFRYVFHICDRPQDPVINPTFALIQISVPRYRLPSLH